jgi:hypothetical protein
VRHLTAALVLLAHALLLCFGTPGMDFLKRTELQSEADRAALRAKLGRPWADLGIALADLNRAVRLPILSAIGAIQRPPRVRQSWHLYRDGPSQVRRLEILADGVLLHRSADDSLGWRAAQLRNRRLRPMIETSVRQTDAANWRGLARWVVAEVRRDLPDTRAVELRAVWSPFPGDAPTWHHSFLAEAPDFQARLVEPPRSGDRRRLAADAEAASGEGGGGD